MSIIFVITGICCIIALINKSTSHKWIYVVGLILSLALFTALKQGGM
jgi:hypothetical protein